MKHLYLLVLTLIVLTSSHLSTAQNVTTANATSQSTCDGTANFSDYSSFSSNWTWTWAWNDSTVISSGDTMITGLCSSGYMLILDSMGVQIYENFTITNPCSPFTYTASVTNCTPSNCDGAISFTPINGTAPYTYQWSNGVTTQSLSNLCPALYGVKCTDAAGCILFYNPAVVDSTQLTPIVPHLTSVNDLTNNNCNGSASLLPTGGTAPYTYQWDIGVTTSFANNLCAGTHSVTIWDALYNDTTINFVILDCAGFVWGVSLINCTPYPQGSCDGGINFTPIGGTAPYTYLWSNGDTTQNLTNACPGHYSVWCTDAIGCANELSSGVGQDTLYALSANLNTADDYISNCSGSASVSPSGGNTPYAILWSNGQISNSISNLCAGIYSVTVWDNLNDSTTVDFIIADSSSIYGNNPYPNGLINDTLYSNLVTNCIIDYNTIDSASLYQAVYDSINQNLYVTWAVYTPTDTTYILDTLGLAGSPGYYALTISVFCPNKSGNDFFKINGVLYFSGTSISTPLQLKENPLESISIYPNPFSNSISVDNKDGVILSMKLIDLNGRVLSEMPNLNSGLIELNQLESVSHGTYLLILSGERISKTYKVIK
ncbi:T9SS type A sorting domain-containing protein [Fluviicola taffensis]|uniref:Secretion system C-terminal sorting domain-containing protein n=1 Tax=Fluviicola taffensis (strain DSM 16823 / NCIMB 13979 / RW262) TaxID=755732 RepID=F2IF98_FLUTR|nr:T9SS type A sorting domain-containing protein [Fluviicola taffensis]AEA43572.1 hypothetical protein Fluta_1580 [Fluviicola taffensis DSM 16823]